MKNPPTPNTPLWHMNVHRFGQSMHQKKADETHWHPFSCLLTGDICHNPALTRQISQVHASVQTPNPACTRRQNILRLQSSSGRWELSSKNELVKSTGGRITLWKRLTVIILLSYNRKNQRQTQRGRETMWGEYPSSVPSWTDTDTLLR